MVFLEFPAFSTWVGFVCWGERVSGQAQAWTRDKAGMQFAHINMNICYSIKSNLNLFFFILVQFIDIFSPFYPLADFSWDWCILLQSMVI